MRGKGKGIDIQTVQTPTPHQGYRGLRSPVVKKIVHFFLENVWSE